LLYIGVTLLGFAEREIWLMTPYKLLALFRVHRAYCPQRKGFLEEAEAGMSDIDIALGGL